MAHTWFQLIAFNALWFASVGGAAGGRPWLGPAALIPYLAAECVWRARLDARRTPAHATSGPARLLALAAAAGALGYLLDSALTLPGLLRFPARAALGWPSPVWMVALWAGFATLLDGSLAWLRGRWLLAAVLGAASGPASYFAGTRLGALSLGGVAGGEGPGLAAALLAVSAEWALGMTLLLLLARWINPPPAPADTRAVPTPAPAGGFTP